MNEEKQKHTFEEWVIFGLAIFGIVITIILIVLVITDVIWGGF